MENIILKKLPHSKIQLEIEVSPASLEKALKKAVQKMAKKNSIPGFRPGKAPQEVIEKTLGSTELQKEACEIAVKENYVEVIRKEKLKVVGAPQITIKKFVPGKNLSFSAIVPILPQITIPELEKLTFKKPALDKIKVTEEEIKQALERLQKMRSKLITVNRGAAEGDRVEIDFKLFMGGVPYEGGSSINHPLVIGEKKFIPGFEDNLIGLKINERKKFSLKFPENYPDQKIGGKKGEFEVVMKLVQKIELPELNDEFAQNVGKFKDLEHCRKEIRLDFQREKETKEINLSLEDLFEALIKNSPLEIPETMIKQEKRKMLAELEGNLVNMGLSVNTYLEQIKKTKEELLKGWDEDAEKRIKISLALQKIAQEKEIKVETENIEERARQFLSELKRRDGKDADLDLEEIKNYLKNALLSEKTIEWLKENILGVKTKS